MFVAIRNLGKLIFGGDIGQLLPPTFAVLSQMSDSTPLNFYCVLITSTLNLLSRYFSKFCIHSIADLLAMTNIPPHLSSFPPTFETPQLFPRFLKNPYRLNLYRYTYDKICSCREKYPLQMYTIRFPLTILVFNIWTK